MDGLEPERRAAHRNDAGLPGGQSTFAQLGGLAVRYSQEAYESQYSWDVQLPYDVEVVHVATGLTVHLGTKMTLAGAPQLSPSGDALTYYDLVKRAWFMQRIFCNASRYATRGGGLDPR